MKNLKKIFSIFITFTTIIWSLGVPLGVLIPLPAEATVTVSNVAIRLNNSETMGSGFTRDIFALNITGSAGEALDKIQVKIELMPGSGADPTVDLAAFTGQANDNQAISIWKDTNSNGWLDPSAGGDQVLAFTVEGGNWAPTPTPGISIAILDLTTNQTLPTSLTSTQFNYFLVMKTSSNPTAGAAFRFILGSDAITTTGTSPTILQATTGVITMAGTGGGYIEEPHIMDLKYIDYNTLDLIWDTDMEANSVNCSTTTCVQYTLNTRAQDTSSIATATLQSNNRTVRIEADSNARIVPGWWDNLTVVSDYQTAPRSTGGIPSTDSMPRFPYMPVVDGQEIVISEAAPGVGGFVELHNYGTAYTLNNWKVKALVNNSEVELVTLSSINLEEGKYYLAAHSSYQGAVSADLSYSTAFNNGDTIFLVDGNNEVRDMIGFGVYGQSDPRVYEGNPYNVSGSGWQSLVRKAFSSSTSATMTSGGTDYNSGNSYDSDDNSYDLVTLSTRDPQNSSSTARIISGYTNNYPYIDHYPVSTFTSGQDGKVIALINDVEDTFSKLDARIYYKISNASWSVNHSNACTSANSCAAGQLISGSDVEFTIPGSVTSSSSAQTNGIDYYIYVKDHDNSVTYSSNYYGASGDSQSQSNAYHASVSTSSGSRSVGGTVYSYNTTTGSCTTDVLAGARVYVDGAGLNDLADGSGVYQVDSVPDGVWNIRATATGYMDAYIYGISVSSNNPNASGQNLCLFLGTEGNGGDVSSPHIIWTSPDNNMSGASTGINISEGAILLGFDKALDSSTVTTSNILLKKIVYSTSTTNWTYSTAASDSDDWTYSYSVGLDTGSGITVDSSTYSFGGTSGNPVVVLYSSTDLGLGETYIVEVTQSLKDSSSNSLPGGSFSLMFSTGYTDSSSVNMGSHYDSTKGGWSGGQYSGFYVLSSYPSSGSWEVPRNTKLTVEFSDPLDETTLTSSYFKLYRVASDGAETELNTSLSLDTSNMIVTVTPQANLSAGHNRLKASTCVKATSGMTMGDPNNCTIDGYIVDFEVGSSSDSTAPMVSGSYPTDDETSVSLGLGFIQVAFNESIDSSTINSSNLVLRAGSQEVSTRVEYDSQDQSAYLVLSNALSTNTTYTLTISGVKDLTSNTISQASINFTTSSTVDTTKPRVEWSEMNDWMTKIVFSKPMNSAAITDTNRWSSSVLNPANYSLNQGSLPNNIDFSWDAMENAVYIEGLSLTVGDSFQVAVSNVVDLLSNALDTTATTASGMVYSSEEYYIGDTGAMGYKEGSFEMESTGFGDWDAKDWAMGWSAGAWPANSMAEMSTTYYIDFPIESQPIPTGGKLTLTFPTGFNVSSVIPDPYAWNNDDLNEGNSGTVTFKTSGVSADAADASTRGGAASDGVTVSGQVVTIWFNVSGNNSQTNAPDFLPIDLDGITNSSIPKDYDTSGYTIDLKSYNASGNLLESKTSMPFYIMSAGNNSLAVNVYLNNQQTPDNKSCSNLELFLGSPMTGPMDATYNITSGAATNAFQNSTLPDGEYYIFMEPTITCGDTDYLGQMYPEPIWLSGGATSTKNIVLTKIDSSSFAPLPVTIAGTFASGGEDIDIFAGGPGNFVVKTVTLTGVTNQQYTLYLPSVGEWWVGIGPAMKNMDKGGKFEMPDWMPPRNLPVKVSGSSPSWTIKDENNNTITTTGLTFSVGSANKQISGRVYSESTTLGAAYTSGGTSLTVASSSGFSSNEQITIVDNSTNPATVVSNKITAVSGTTWTLDNSFSVNLTSGATVYKPIAAEIWAYQPMGFGGSGSNTKSSNDGSFTLKVAEYGVYSVSAWAPGFPQAPDTSVETRSGTGSSTQVYINARLSTGSTGSNPFLVRMKQSQYTISGKISNTSGVSLQWAPVWAVNINTGFMAYSGTDQNGSYSLFVDEGTWTIEAEIPPGSDVCGSFSKSVTVTSTTGSLSNQNIQPSLSSCYTVAGTVSAGGSNLTNIPVFLEEWDTTNNRPAGGYHRDTMTDANGQYKFKVGNGTYRIGTWTPDYGEMLISGGSVTVNGANLENQNITAATLSTVTIPIENGSLNLSNITGIVVIENDEGDRRVESIEQGDLSGDNPTLTYSLPAGDTGTSTDDYDIQVHLTGIGDFSQDNVDLTSNVQATTVDISSATLRTLSGTVEDNSGDPLKNVLVALVDPATGDSISTTTDSGGNYSLLTKECNDCELSAAVIGYTAPAVQTIDVAGGNVNFDFDSDTDGEDVSIDNDLVLQDEVLTGRIYDSDGTTPVAEGAVWAENSSGEISFSQINSDGTYKIPVSDGTWTVKAIAPGHETTQLTTAHTVETGSTDSGLNVTLNEDTGNIVKTRVVSLNPSSGGVIDDTNNSGLKITVPPGALGTGTTPVTLTIEENYNVPSTSSSFDPIGETAISIEVKDHDGQIISQFNDEVEITVAYDATEIQSLGVSESSLMATYFDTTVGNYVPIDAVVDTTANTITTMVNHFTAFAPSAASDNSAPTTPTNLAATAGNGTITLTWTASTDDVSVAGYEVYRSSSLSGTYTNISGDSMSTGSFNRSSLVTSTTYQNTSLTNGTTYYYKVAAFDTSGNNSAVTSVVYGTPTSGTSTGGGSGSYDFTAPKAPSEVKLTLNADNTITVTWTDPTDSDLSQIQILRGKNSTEVSATPITTVSKGVKTYTDKDITVDASYTYIVRAKDTTGNLSSGETKYTIKATQPAAGEEPVVTEELTTPAEETPAEEEEIEEAPTVEEVIIPVAPATRDEAAENEAQAKVKEILGKEPQTAAETQVVNFIAYGTTAAEKLSQRDREGVMTDYFHTYGILPANDQDWQDVEKVLTGHKPTVRSLNAEQYGLPLFMEVYKKLPNDPKYTAEQIEMNWWAVHYISYKIRPTYRDLDKEKFAIGVFKDVFGRLPSSELDWAVVRAVAYTGASR